MKNSTPYASTQNAHIRAFKRHRVTPRNWLGRKTGTVLGSFYSIWKGRLLGKQLYVVNGFLDSEEEFCGQQVCLAAAT
ncbi:hypothetical protein AGOR_G00113750 [Albula goreensis]|uniref:Uncharacterized protein n=1 Tax=Albula goreensis TaxID=1534307 RepID=A0A8T3DFJ1_9TELE|nr:hypothetical protein AGOR_G00113750 [Albula goreensis]